MAALRTWQCGELDAGFRQFAYVVLDAPEAALNRLDAVVCIRVVGSVVRRLELLESKSAPNAAIAFSSAAYCRGKSSRWRTIA
jgi:hypothetical protein